MNISFEKLNQNILLMINNGQVDEAEVMIRQYKNYCQVEEIFNYDLYFLEFMCLTDTNLLAELEIEFCKNGEKWLYDIEFCRKILKISYRKNLKFLFLKAYVALEILDSNVDLSEYNSFVSQEYGSKTENYKVFQGPINIANQLSVMTSALKRRGIDARSFSLETPNYLNYKIDEYVDFSKYANQEEQVGNVVNWISNIINEYDIFHFHFGLSLMVTFQDLKLIKKFGKKTVMSHWGSDVRKFELAKKISPFATTKQDSVSIHTNMNSIKPYIDVCMVCDMELFYYTKEYYKNIEIVPIAYDFTTSSDIKLENKTNEKFRIVHAPTSREFKGTFFIEKAIKNLLEKNYNIEYVLVEGVSNEEALKIYETADVVIDQLRAGQYGFLAIECMVRNIPVIAYVSEYMSQYHDIDLPVINANIEDVESVLEDCINNIEKTKLKGKSGYEYVRKHHDIDKIVENIMCVYEKLLGDEYEK